LFHSKSDIYRELLPLVNSGRIELLDNTRLVAQLCFLERRTARGGRDSIDHPPNGRDDVSNAAAGALLLAASSVAKDIGLAPPIVIPKMETLPPHLGGSGSALGWSSETFPPSSRR
jgi:hypothetical protein